MKTSLASLIRPVAMAAGLAAVQAQAQSYYERLHMGAAGGGCPFCGGGGIQPDNPDLPPAPVTDTTPPPETPAVTPATPTQTSSTVTAIATAVASSSKAKPVLTKAQAAAIAAQSAVVAPDMTFKRASDGYLSVNFSQLASYRFDLPEAGAVAKPGSVERIPEVVQGLNNQRVRMSGFMVPVKVEGGLTTEFLVVRSPMVCCYGVMPAPNEWVCVKAPGKGVPMKMDTPLQFTGTLHVGEIYENNFFVGVYRLDADTVAVN